MPSLFDGLGTVTRGIFGATVTVTPTGGGSRDITAVFRERAVSLVEDGVEFTVVRPFLDVARAESADLVPDALVDPGNGKTYAVVSSQDLGGPANDGRVRLLLEKV